MHPTGSRHYTRHIMVAIVGSGLKKMKLFPSRISQCFPRWPTAKAIVQRGWNFEAWSVNAGQRRRRRFLVLVQKCWKTCAEKGAQLHLGWKVWLQKWTKCKIKEVLIWARYISSADSLPTLILSDFKLGTSIKWKKHRTLILPCHSTTSYMPGVSYILVCCHALN